jgi:long-chain acyl-CoA synthetase
MPALNWFEQVLGRWGDLPLAEDDTGRTLTYASVLAAAAPWRTRLSPERRLAILLISNSAPGLEAYLSLAASGYAVFLLDLGANETVVRELIDRYDPDLVVRASETGIAIEERTSSGSVLHADLSVLLSTSGSTGSPKAVRFTDRMLAANAESIAEYLGLTSNERALAHLPLQYSFGLSVLHSHMAAGAKVLLTQRSFMQPEFWQRAEQATSLAGVPFHFEMLERLRFERRNLPNLRTLAQAGGRMPADRVKRLAELAAQKGWRLFVMYGQTEAGPRIAYLPPGDAIGHAGAIGKPIPGVTMELVEPDGTTITAADQEGELIVVSPSVMMGYASTRADLVNGDTMAGRLATGDLAVRAQDGYFRITGRKSDFVKLQGNRVSLADVERRLAALGIEASCVGVDDRLWIVIEGQPPEDRLQQVREASANAFGFPARSATVVGIDQIPRSPAMKVLYKELLAKVTAADV